MSVPPSGDLPFTDTKPQGSADFYFATNATFRFILRRLGPAGWRKYLGDLGRSYYAPVNRQWREGGLPAHDCAGVGRFAAAGPERDCGGPVMIGCYDFCAHYEWTFAWLEQTGGHTLVRDYWNEAFNHDSQRHARELIEREGFAGMAKYWGHTLAEESPDLGFNITSAPGVFRVDMHDCPSKGFLIRNDLAQYRDYCDHCMGWIGPMMREAGFVIDHEHNHCGQCWWRCGAPTTAAGTPRRARSRAPRTCGCAPTGIRRVRSSTATSRRRIQIRNHRWSRVSPRCFTCSGRELQGVEICVAQHEAQPHRFSGERADVAP